MKNWVLWGGCFLAWQAAFINVIFLLLTGASVSHMTGDFSRLMADIAKRDFQSSHWALMGVALLGFVGGAIISGFRLSKAKSSWQLYSKAFMTMSSFLATSYYLTNDFILLSVFLGGIVCGMQNGLAKEYRGVILRSTHLTGIFTDIGVLFGRKLRGESIETWKFYTLCSLVLFFSLGGISGSIAWSFWKEDSLIIPIIAYMMGTLLLRIILPKLPKI